MRRLALISAVLGIAGIIAVGCSKQSSPTPIMLMTLPPIGTPGQVTLVPNYQATIVTETPSAPGESTPAGTDGGDSNAIVVAATAALAAQLGVPTTQITYVSSVPTEWPDSSLGCPQAGVAYTPVETPGYVITLMSGSSSYEVHTDLAGTAVICQPGGSVTSGGGLADPIVEEFINQAKSELAAKLGVAEGDIAVVRSEAVDWADTSLGCAERGKSYQQIISPGYRIILGVDEKRYEYHTDQNQMIRCDAPTQ
jgi:hypothetical protein